MNDLIVLVQDSDNIEYLKQQFPHLKTLHVKNRKVCPEVLQGILSLSLTKFVFVVIDPNVDIFNFKFDYVPEVGTEHFVHIWNDSLNIRLYNRRDLVKTVGNFTDSAIAAGKVEFKNHEFEIQTSVQYDVFYLSYFEPAADEKFKHLQTIAPHAQHIKNVKGIFNAHKTAANLAKTAMMYIVDADAEIINGFDFSYIPPDYDRKYVHVWRSMNPVNDLEYGYGGIKLFPVLSLRTAGDWNIDFTTSVAAGLKLMSTVSNITRFNTGLYESWKSAFRECTKLAASAIKNGNAAETEGRLNTWCTVGEARVNGDFVIAGARAGKEFGTANRNNPAMLSRINDFSWLREQFRNQYRTFNFDRRSQQLYSAYTSEYHWLPPELNRKHCEYSEYFN